MKTGSTEDRLEIRELNDVFSTAVWRIDAELFGSTWAEDGAWKLPSMSVPVTGRSNIQAAFKTKMEYVGFIGVFAFPSEVAIDGDKARGTTYVQEMIYPKAGGKRLALGRFIDEYVKQKGRWYFLSRTYELLHMEET